jgi:hypothetical protein
VEGAMKIFKLKILDKIVIVILVILGVLPAGIVMLAKPTEENSNIIIRIDNKVVRSVPLSNGSERKTYEFSFNNNLGYVEVKDGKVRMLEMGKDICPDAICSETGWIDKSYQSIVCLPNKIVVTIESNNNKDEAIDAQSY